MLKTSSARALFLVLALLAAGCSGDVGRYQLVQVSSDARERNPSGVACRLDTRSGEVACFAVTFDFALAGDRFLPPGPIEPRRVAE
jgi:hypothetical protein